MSQVLVTESYLEDIADAIREKNGTETTYKPPQMAAAIEALPDPSVLDSKSITANGTYDPSDDDLDGYDEVTVNVPNSYAAGDEGKVVSNGALVAQGSDTVTENDTYDTTLISSLIVNVSSGGSASVKIMNQGQVSTTSAYATATFDSAVDFSLYNALRFDMYREGVKVGTTVIGKSGVNESFPTGFTIYSSAYNYTMNFSENNKTIRCAQYAGSYVNLYVDVYGCKV
jgi:hypothetical protein